MRSPETPTLERVDHSKPTHESLYEQEQALQFSAMGHAEALQLGIMMTNMAREKGHPVAIGIDLGEQAAFRTAMPGTCADHGLWLDRKFAAVRRFDRSSLELELRVEGTPSYASDRALRNDQMALVGGAFPLRVAGNTVGVAGVAGMRSTEDHAFVVLAIRHFLKSK